MKQLDTVPGQERGCGRCEVVNPAPTGPGRLHLRFPLGHTRGKLVMALSASGRTVTEQGDVLSVRFDEIDLGVALAPLMKVLKASEANDITALFEKDGSILGLSEYLGARPLATFFGRAQSGWLTTLLTDGRLHSVFQPIVDAQTTEIFAHECLARGKEPDGSPVFPDRLFGVARSADLLFQLDLAARLSAIRGSAEFGLQGKIFINFNPSAIYDPVYCLASTAKAVSEHGLTPDQIVFEVVESDRAAEPNFLVEILTSYRKAGFQVALDDLGAGYSSLGLMTRIRPDYVKLDMEIIRDVDKDPYKAQLSAKLLEAARALGVSTVAEGVETQGEYDWVRTHGADYVQGYYFAKPATPPPSVQKR